MTQWHWNGRSHSEVMGSCQNGFRSASWIQSKMVKWTWHGWWCRPPSFSTLKKHHMERSARFWSLQIMNHAAVCVFFYNVIKYFHAIHFLFSHFFAMKYVMAIPKYIKSIFLVINITFSFNLFNWYVHILCCWNL